MSTPFSCVWVSPKKKTRYKTQNATLCDAVYRRRRNEKSGLSNSIPRARERGGVSLAFSRRRRRNPSSCPVLFFSSCQSRFVEHKKRCVGSIHLSFFARCPPRKASRSRVSSPMEESMERPLEKGIVRARASSSSSSSSSSSLPFRSCSSFPRDDDGEKGPPRTKKGVEIWVGWLTKNIFKKITKNS